MIRSKRVAKPNPGRRSRKQTNWLKRNRVALEAYNGHVEKHGVFSDGLRPF
jgi:antitoxin CcdA